MSDASRVRIIRGLPEDDGPMEGGSPHRGTGARGRGRTPGGSAEARGDLGPFLAMVGEHRRRAEAEAEARLQEAAARAAEMLAEARAEAEDIRQQAFTEGYGLGEQAAREEMSREADALLGLLRSAIESAQRAYEEALARARGDILKLALAIAEKIIRNHVETDPAAIEGLLDDLLPRWEGAAQMTIRCHPDDAAVIEAYLERLAAEGRPQTDVTVVPTDHIARGGCVVESSYGELDARLETRIARVAERLAQWAHEADGGASGAH